MPIRKDFVVYFYDEQRAKNYVHYQNHRVFTDLNPKKAFEMSHSQAIKILAKHGQQFGGGLENHTDAYADYVFANEVPAEEV
ncbi:hypothetical protein [Apilactobacillus xinyiensis]|uniref:hypothetical protein n=1 Tax=Apilactobacillus xinyiensis TaxID=2841032 RepID=UPI00200D0407|nr:hypothetical protein [Apilactobacillus xinyiensis]MCL0319409.1 hypothetical protein [Apilactobacillus xinyiensis]